MRILVCGGRSFGHVVRTKGDPKDEPPETQLRLQEYTFAYGCLHEIVDPHGSNDVVIISGGATGADRVAATFAEVNFYAYEEYPADWKQYGKRAGYLRNVQMLQEGRPDLVVAFPGGRGTAMMVDLARKANVKVIEMGAKGSQTMADTPPKFKTNKYEKMYCDRMGELRGFATPGQRMGILHELLKAEKEWLETMGNEYDEIMQAQNIMDGMNGPSSD